MMHALSTAVIPPVYNKKVVFRSRQEADGRVGQTPLTL